jgi:hypothetical protein
MTMKTSLLLAACLAMPLMSFAAAPASADAAASSAAAKEAVHASKTRGSANGACQQKATDQKLMGEERKAFMVTCMKG